MNRQKIEKNTTAQHSPKSKIMISVRLTPYLHQETARIAGERGCSLSLAVRALLQYAIDCEADADKG